MELAKKLNVTDKAVSRWERGLGFPDINTLEPLADALGVSVLELMQSKRTDNEKLISTEKAEEMLILNQQNIYKSQPCGKAHRNTSTNVRYFPIQCCFLRSLNKIHKNQSFSKTEP